MAINALLSSESNEWYTPPEIITAVRQVLGTIDLDPASCVAANKMIGATRYFTKEDNGVTHSIKWPPRPQNAIFGRLPKRNFPLKSRL